MKKVIIYCLCGVLCTFIANSTNAIDTKKSFISQPCHPAGDLVPCSHPLHNGDVIPCVHVCYGPYGAYRCHPYGDVIPCSHPVHSLGDYALCVHECW